MYMRSKLSIAAVLFASAAFAQQGIDPRSTLNITFPEDSPVAVLSANWGESNATARGGALLIDLHTSLTLRNSSTRRIRSITLLVMAQEVTPGGKASVSVPSLNVGPGEVFPVRIDVNLLRPLQAAGGALVEVGLDGVLFDDMGFFGPNRLNSRRSMTVWELEARRDRRYFKRVLESLGPDALQREMMASINRQAERSRMDARIALAPVTNQGAERNMELAFLEAPNAPLEASQGRVRISRNEARAPQLYLRNRSDRQVEAMEVGWLVKDSRGRQFVTGGVPMDISLRPRQGTSVVQETSFRFTQGGGEPIEINEISAFLSSVEFADGNMWVPDRNSKIPTPSPEEQRLAEMYRKRGLQAVAEELKKY